MESINIILYLCRVYNAEVLGSAQTVNIIAKYSKFTFLLPGHDIVRLNAIYYNFVDMLIWHHFFFNTDSNNSSDAGLYKC